MPSLQLDVPATYDSTTKRLLGKRFGSVYAAVMQTRPDIITVSIRDLGEGAVWRCGEDDPQPHALLICHVRQGRSAETRAELARQLIGACRDVLGWDPHRLKVEFTQHSGDEVYQPHLNGFNRDWLGESTH
ncbi:tautomerase [Mycobacterium sp.]|uniref:tautomerase n=1 Tax=Mycobacterium sp. TaxID=1785 RepID=UPI003C8975F9